MDIEKKALLILLVFIIALLAFISVFVTATLLANYRALERDAVAGDLDQVVGRIGDDEVTLSAIVSDWGPWNDTYRFVNGGEPDYVRTNLQASTYENLRLNFIVITNRSGDIVYAGAYDLANRTFAAVPAELGTRRFANDPLVNPEASRGPVSGIIVLAGGPALVASHPVVFSDFSGTPQGVVIVGRYLDSARIARLDGGNVEELGLVRIGDPSVSPSVLSALSTGGSSQALVIEPINKTAVVGYVFLRDITGRDALVLSITESRDIYNQGLGTAFQFILIILGSGLLLGIMVIILLDRLVLAKIGALALQVHAIGRDKDLSRRIRLEGDDQISGLADEINRMLETLRDGQMKIRASEARFRELADLLPQIIFEMDTAGTLTYVNRFGLDMFGLAETDLTGMVQVRRFLAPDDIPRMEKNLKIVASGGKSPGEVYTVVGTDGSRIRAIIHTSPIVHEGRLEGFRGSIIDITQHEEVRDALRESEAMLANILRVSPVGVFRNDPEGKIVYVNDTWVAITGTTFGQVRGRYWVDELHPGDRERVRREAGEAIRDRGIIRTETRFQRPDGKIIWLYIQAVPLGNTGGGAAGRVGAITDITERKAMEVELRESEEKYRALAENTADILFSLDTNGVFTYVSPLVNRYGYLVEDVTSHALSDFIYPDDRRAVLAGLRREIDGERVESSIFRMVDKWGYLHWIEKSSTIRVDVFGKPIGLYGVLRDITDRRRAEEAMQLANKKLNLLNNITRHDIINTLTGLIGCTDMAAAIDSKEEHALLLAQIKEQARIIKRQITFTREYQEIGVNTPVWQNLKSTLEHVIANFSYAKIAFVLDLEDTEIYADPLLEKVFYNLIDNAIRYGETIRTIRFYHQISDKGLALVCEDDGVGIPAKEKERIFERGVGRNTGMGLFLSREILTITGITIRETGIPGEGARFELLIPNGAWHFVTIPKR